jgi:hypothetical protein
MLHPLCFSRFCSEGILERGDTKFLQRYKATSDKPGRPSDDVVRRRDSNYNCSETEDAHISR